MLGRVRRGDRPCKIRSANSRLFRGACNRLSPSLDCQFPRLVFAIVYNFWCRGDSDAGIGLYGFGMLRIRVFSFDPSDQAGVIAHMRCYQMDIDI